MPTCVRTEYECVYTYITCVYLWKVNKLFNYSMNMYNHRLDMSAGLPMPYLWAKRKNEVAASHRNSEEEMTIKDYLKDLTCRT